MVDNSLPDVGVSFDEPGINTQIEQADKALHPEAKQGLMGLVMKARIKPHLKPYVDHILSRGIQRGKFNIFGDSEDYNAAEAMVMADFLTSVAVDGRGREDLIEMVTELPNHKMNWGGNNQGGGNYRENIK